MVSDIGDRTLGGAASSLPGPVGHKPVSHLTRFNPSAALTTEDLPFNPNAALTTQGLPKFLLWLFSLPHNQVWLRSEFALTPEQKAQEVLAQIDSGFRHPPRVEEFCGPKKFLRGVGSENAVYAGSWWFDEDLLVRIEEQLSRIPLPQQDHKTATRVRLRAALAICKDWKNSLEEIWVLEIPQGERLTGLVGTAREQPEFSCAHPEHDPKKILPGGAEQVFFPIKNPLWVRLYSQKPL